MGPFKLLCPLYALAIVACTQQQRSGAVADTTQFRGDTSALRRPSAADTQDGASPGDTLKRPRPTGMQRPETGLTPAKGARRDSAPKPRD
jgi:hypothetical protein